MNKAERIKQAIATFPHDQFRADDIHNSIKMYGVTGHYLRSMLSKLAIKGEIRRVEKIGHRAGSYIVYSKKPLDKSKAHTQEELPLELPMEKVGEAILAAFQILKRQVNELEQKVESTRNDANNWRKQCRELQKTIDHKNKELETVTEALRNKTGKTFSMSEVARVIRNGRLITPEAPGAS